MLKELFIFVPTVIRCYPSLLKQKLKKGKDFFTKPSCADSRLNRAAIVTEVKNSRETCLH